MPTATSRSRWRSSSSSPWCRQSRPSGSRSSSSLPGSHGTTAMLRIGLVEDNPGDARLIQEMLREPPITQFRLTHSTRMDQLLENLERDPIEVLLLDLGLPDSQGMDTFHRINNRLPEL